MAENRNFWIGLVVAGFIAGVAAGVTGTLWITRSSSPAEVASTPEDAESDTSAIEVPTGVFINEKSVDQEQVSELRDAYGVAPPPGHYWYDPRSGLYGVWGHEAIGYIRPGHNLGSVPVDASKGNTGVYVNGRQINQTEAEFIQKLFGVAYQGRWWLDGQNGNLGVEGNNSPLANMIVAMRQARGQDTGDTTYRWRDQINHPSSVAACLWSITPC